MHNAMKILLSSCHYSMCKVGISAFSVISERNNALWFVMDFQMSTLLNFNSTEGAKPE